MPRHVLFRPGRRLIAESLALALLLLAGCSLDVFRKQEYRVTGEPDQLRYKPELNVDLARMTRTPSGLYYRDLAVGEGPSAAPGTLASVEYKGWLADGSLFDQSGAGQPYTFPVGGRRVIPGWDEGVAGMRVGGRRQLVIRPLLAYGNVSPGAGIPPNATLVFDVTLVAVQ